MHDQATLFYVSVCNAVQFCLCSSRPIAKVIEEKDRFEAAPSSFPLCVHVMNVWAYLGCFPVSIPLEMNTFLL